MANRSLYYPYIHLRDPDWLKATLLVFSQVYRMTPVPGRQPDDDEAIVPFTQWNGGREPMLTTANLNSTRAIAAQTDLATRLRKDGEDPAFLERFGRFTTEASRPPGELGFQIHQAKLHEKLKCALRDTELAWKPMSHEPYDLWEEYVELNEQIGQAVMASLAIACAEGQGLDIVGDARSGPLHDCLVKKRPEDVYDAWLKPKFDIGKPRKPNAQELFELLITLRCDPRKLDAEALANIGADREPINHLIDELARRAQLMDAMDPGPERTKQFEDEASKILRAWEADRKNMSNFWKRFFGFGLLETGGKTLEKMISKALETAPAAATATTGALAGLALQGPVLAAGAGLGIGLFTHAAKTYIDMVKKDEDSPYRYLTLMEEGGVVIRADMRRMSLK